MTVAGGVRPRVAVCVVTYNHARYIEDCLLSVLSQAVDADVSIIVGDDGSTDGTSDLIVRLDAAWPGRITHVLHSERRGPIGNYLSIIARAEGDFVAHLDGDDFWLPGKLREQIELLERHPSAMASCTNAVVFDDSREPVGVFTNARAGLYSLDDLMRRGNFLNHSSLLYRASQKDRILALAPPFIDYRMHAELATRGPIVFTSKTLVGYRANATGSMLSNANASVREAYFDAIQFAIPHLSPRARVAACVDMMRRVVFRSLRTRDIRMLATWWARLSRAASVPAPRFVAQLLASVVREASRQGVQALSGRMLGARNRVLYFR
ncbi:glycosyltransferase [Luteibacter sp. 329MFSha]|uniref:glycosyltransferase n=1 Tax=Luteibacter sp. 329MFSha TaxID=1798239 RepID=UPI0008D3655A|nr:glycosyltransferase [Luteibacter sp. 329MFSha]SEW01863.1 Glycosyltransferase involved in cell wall bisynthesis [Luteibacter sp. 329MFSha]